MSRQPPTAREVAQLAGVSQPTVSRVFSAPDKVSAKVTARVRAAAAEIGYRPNRLARSLITGRSRTIGLVVAYLDNPFYATTIDTLCHQLQAAGYSVQLMMARNMADEVDSLLDTLLDHQVEGMVLASVSISSELTTRLAEQRIPTVLFNRGQDRPGLCSVTSANRAGARRVAEFLVAGEHRRIAHIAGWRGSSTGRDREQGFIEGLAARDVPLHACLAADYRQDLAQAATRELIAMREPPDAIFVANDHMALAVADTLRFELGCQLGEDISLVGYDDIDMASWDSYRLTTVRQPARRMVEATVDLLLATLDEPALPARQIEIPGPLQVRRSARVPSDWPPPEPEDTAP